MARNFEEFMHCAVHIAGARVSLTNRGYFNFNRTAYELLGQPEAIIYLYDHETKAVGFAPSTRLVRHAYRVNRIRQTCAISFCDHHGIKIGKRAVRCDAVMEEGRLVIELPRECYE